MFQIKCYCLSSPGCRKACIKTVLYSSGKKKDERPLSFTQWMKDMMQFVQFREDRLYFEGLC